MTDALRSALATIAAAIGGLDDADRLLFEQCLFEALYPRVESLQASAIVRYLASAGVAREGNDG